MINAKIIISSTYEYESGIIYPLYVPNKKSMVLELEFEAKRFQSGVKLGNHAQEACFRLYNALHK